MHVPRTTFVLLLALFVALVGCGKKPGGGQADAKGPPGIGDPGGKIPVQVAQVTLGTITQSVPVTGSIQALQDVQLAARAAGRVVAVSVREGDFVSAGQVVVQQDATDLLANVRQAQANVESALAKVSQAQTNVQIQKTQARQGVLQAQATLAAARQNLAKVRSGLRPQEKLQQQNLLLSARANLENARTTLTRNQTLYKEGAIAKAELDTAQTNFDVLSQQYKNAQASVALAQAGGRAEDVASAQSQVSQQQTALQIALANQKQVSVRRDDILAAQAAVAQARATLAFNQQQVANASIRSPISGLVADRLTEPGQIASPGTVLMRIVNIKTMYYEPTVSETDLENIKVGNPVIVRADALPGRTFSGRIKTVFPAAAATDRTFRLRVTVPNASNLLRPGMFARGEIAVKVARSVPVIPATALLRQASAQGFESNASSDKSITGGAFLPPSQVVVVGPDDTAQIRPVKVGIVTMTEAQITGGLRAGERIVIVGQTGLKPGDKLAIEKTDSKETRSARI